MFNTKVKSLFIMALLPFLASATNVLAQDCPSCVKNANVKYAAPANQFSQREVVRPVVQNFDCANPQQNYALAAPAPMPQPARVRNMPQKVQVLPYVERNNEKVLRPLTDKEVSQRLGSPSGYMVSESRDKKYVMSSRTERQAAVEPHYRDGSIFGGGPCRPSDKNAGIFGGGSCGPSNKTILASGPCKSCKGSTILPSAPCHSCAKPAPAMAPVPVMAPAPMPAVTPAPVVNCPNYLATTVTYTKLPCVGTTAPCMPRPTCPCAAPSYVTTTPIPCPCMAPRPMPAPVRDCSRFAPISMEWVDFRLQKGADAKAYSKSDDERRFKIFGCRSLNKSSILNEGRLLEKDMNFNEIFADMVSDCYKVVSTQQCIDENTILPEYVLTAEITDYFMNLCKDNAWKKAKDAPKGSSEMKVVWRLLDLSRTNVVWKGESIGHGELVDGDEEDEMLLIQRAFADATQKLRNLPGFEDRLLLRLTPEGMAKKRQYLIEMQRISGVCQPAVVENCGLASSACRWVAVQEQPVETPAVEVAIETPKPEKPVTSSAIFEADKICIVERDATSATPDDLPMIRKSIVSITNAKGEQGVGLLISEQFVMTSADLVVREDNQYTVKTTDGKTLNAKAFRVNPRRNTALLVLNEQTEYTPLALNLELPAVDKDTFLSVGSLAFDNDDKYLQNTSRINSYRYAEDGAAEIVVDSFDYGTTIGATLVDENGKVVALAHRKQPQSGDLFLPFETAMRSLGVEICGKEFPEPAPKPVEKVWRKPVAEFIDEPAAKAPEAMPVKNRK